LAVSKDLTQLIKEVKKAGWEVILNKNCHLKWVSPNGRFFFSASTPSDHRAILNIKRDLKTHGFIELKKQNRKHR